MCLCFAGFPVGTSHLKVMEREGLGNSQAARFSAKCFPRLFFFLLGSMQKFVFLSYPLCINVFFFVQFSLGLIFFVFRPRQPKNISNGPSS